MTVLSTNFNGNLAPLIETNERYIMQGQVYGKDDMKFEFMNFLPVNTTNSFHMPSLIRRCTSIRDDAASYDWHSSKSRGDMYIVDNNDPTVSYCIVDSNAQSDHVSRNRIIKIKTENGITKKIWDSNFKCPLQDHNVDAISYTAVEILGQSDKYIIICFARSSRQNAQNVPRYNQHIIKKFDKVTGSYSDVFDYDDDRHVTASAMYGTAIKKIYETKSDIYFYFFNGFSNTITIDGVAVGQSAVYRYDKTSDTKHKLGTIDASSTKTGNTLFSSQGFMEDVYIYFYAYSNITNPEMRLIKIDTTTQSIATKTVVTTFNSNIDSLPRSNSSNAEHHSKIVTELFIKECNGKKYLNVIGYSTRAKASDDYLNRITTFLIDESNEYDLIAQDYCDPFSNTAIRGFIEMIDENLLLITNRNAAKVLRFDNIKGKYVEIQIINIPNNSIGCDSKNNIWITDISNTLHKFTVELPVDVQLSFEKEAIDYKGTDIDTNILLEAYNYMNERVSVKLELTIKGPMTFTDGSKSMTITSSKFEQIKIPTIVKGSGIISVFPKIIL